MAKRKYKLWIGCPVCGTAEPVERVKGFDLPRWYRRHKRSRCEKERIESLRIAKERGEKEMKDGSR